MARKKTIAIGMIVSLVGHLLFCDLDRADRLGHRTKYTGLDERKSICDEEIWEKLWRYNIYQN